MNLNRQTAILGVLALPAAAWGQTHLYSNGNADPSNPGLSTGALTLSGVPAPAGAQWSETPRDAQAANAIAGFSAHARGAAGTYRFADDFTVPPGGWRVERFSFFAYQPGAAGSPFVGLSLRLWEGRPGDPGSRVIFGDDATSRLSGVSATNLYRVFNSVAAPQPQAPDTSRRLWRLDADAITGFGGPPQLEPGTYWVDWQFTVAGDGPAFTPPVTLAGSRGPAGAGARQLRPTLPPALALWADALDPGKPESAPDVRQDLPFLVLGGPGCAGDLNGDDTVDFNDLLVYLNAFNAQIPDADLNRDGSIDFNDMLEFLNRYTAACG